MTNSNTINTIDDILNYDFRNNTTQSFLINNFLPKFSEKDKKIINPKFSIYTKISLPNSKKETITIGRYIFNKFCLPEIYLQEYGYINTTINKKVYKTIFNNLNVLVMRNKLSREEFADTIDRIYWLGSIMANTSGESFDSDSLLISDKLKKEIKQELDKLDDNTPLPEVQKVEEKFIKKAIEEKKDSSLINIIGSGSKGNFTNNYKNLVLFRGKTIDGKLVKDNLTDGNSFDSYTKLGNNAVFGSFSRSSYTALGGYSTKLVNAAFNFTAVEEDDCGTDQYLRILLDDFDKYKFRTVSLKRNKNYFETLNYDNKDKYMNKMVYMRSPMFCRSKNGICKKCFGEIYKYTNADKMISNVLTILTSTIQNKSMKAFHNLVKDVTTIDLNKI